MPIGHVSQTPPIHTGESAAHVPSEVFRCHHGCGFASGDALYVLLRCRRVVGIGGVGVARVCGHLLSCCLLFPGFLSLLIGPLPPLIDDAVSSLRAEVVDREDTVKQRLVETVVFGPVTRVPGNTANVIAVLEQLDSDESVFLPGNTEPVFQIVFVLRHLDVAAANLANNSLPISTRHLHSFVLACTPRPFLNSSGRVNHFVVLADLVQASLEQFKDNFFGRLVSLEGFLILTLLVRAPVGLRLWRVLLNNLNDFLLQGSPLQRLLFLDHFPIVLLLGPSRPALRGAEPWERVLLLQVLVFRRRLLMLLLLRLLSLMRKLLLAVVLLVLFDSVRRFVLLNQKVIINSVKFLFGQSLVIAIAKAVYCVDASVIESLALSVDNLERYFHLPFLGVQNILDKKISARFLPSPLKLAID